MMQILAHPKSHIMIYPRRESQRGLGFIRAQWVDSAVRSKAQRRIEKTESYNPAGVHSGHLWRGGMQMFERLKKTDLRHGKFFDAPRRWPYPLGLTDRQQRKPLCALCAAFRFSRRPHKTRASGRDWRPWLYPRSTACYPCELTAADTI